MDKRLRKGSRFEIGFTLIELLVTIMILAIVMTWVVPSYRQFAARNQVAAEVIRLRTALTIARNTSITQHTETTICPSINQRNCTIQANAKGQDWLAPLTLFRGTGKKGDVVLRNFGRSFSTKLTYRNDTRPVRYNALGYASGHNGTFRICGRHGEGAQVVVSNFGRIRIENKTPTTCLP